MKSYRQNLQWWRFSALFIVGMTAVVGCESEKPDDTKCVVATAPGHEWTTADADEFVLQIQPAPGDRAERQALFVDALTAFGAKEGGFNDYDPAVTLRHHRELMADLHFERTFEEGTSRAVEAFAAHREELSLEVLECP